MKDDIETELKRINKALAESTPELERCAGIIFEIARNDGVSFDEACKNFLNAKCVPATREEIERLSIGYGKRNPKIGCIEMSHLPKGTRNGDWVVLVNGSRKHKYIIQSASDIGGWFEHVKREPTMYYTGGKELLQFESTRTYHVKARIRFVYTGDNPHYSAFKDKNQTTS